MELVKFISPETGNSFYINPSHVVSLTHQRVEGGCVIHLTDCDGGKDDYYLADCGVDEAADKINNAMYEDSVSQSIRDAFGVGVTSTPSFLEAIAMCLGVKNGVNGINTDSSVHCGLNDIASALKAISE